MSRGQSLDTRALYRELCDFREQAEAAEEDGGERLSDDDRDRLNTLERAAADVGGDVALRDIGTLIHDDEFADYAREYAEDGLDLDTRSWPLTCIDWKEAASDLQSDFSSVEIDGDMYWYYG